MLKAEVYQMSHTEDNVGKIFFDFNNESIDLSQYNKVAEIEVEEDSINNIDILLEEIFQYGNTNPMYYNDNPKARSISVSDIIKFNDRYYYVQTMGFEDVTDNIINKKEESKENGKRKLSFEEYKDIYDPYCNLADDELWLMYKSDKDTEYTEEEIAAMENEIKQMFDNMEESKGIQKKVEEAEDIGKKAEENEDEIEDDENQTIYDLIVDREGVDLSIGEFNTILQSIFAKFNEIFLTTSEFYDMDPEEDQNITIWDDEDEYTITFKIKDQIDPTIEIIDVEVL